MFMSMGPTKNWRAVNQIFFNGFQNWVFPQPKTGFFEVKVILETVSVGLQVDLHISNFRYDSLKNVTENSGKHYKTNVVKNSLKIKVHNCTFWVKHMKSQIKDKTNVPRQIPAFIEKDFECCSDNYFFQTNFFFVNH